MLSLSLPLLLLWAGFLPLVYVKSEFSIIFFNCFIILIRRLLVTVQDFSSTTWYADNSTPSLRDRTWDVLPRLWKRNEVRV